VEQDECVRTGDDAAGSGSNNVQSGERPIVPPFSPNRQ
jgi:hypothetical protein